MGQQIIYGRGVQAQQNGAVPGVQKNRACGGCLLEAQSKLEAGVGRRREACGGKQGGIYGRK